MKKWVAILFLAASTNVFANTCESVVSGKVTFSIVQLGAPFEGTFSKIGGSVCRDKDTVTEIDVWLDPSSVDTGLPELDEMLQGPILFHTREHPRATYLSKTIEGGPSDYRAKGKFSLKGIERDMQVQFKLDGQSLSGEVQMMRLAHDVGTGEWAQTDLLSDEVRVRFKAVLKP